MSSQRFFLSFLLLFLFSPSWGWGQSTVKSVYIEEDSDMQKTLMKALDDQYGRNPSRAFATYRELQKKGVAMSIPDGFPPVEYLLLLERAVKAYLEQKYDFQKEETPELPLLEVYRKHPPLLLSPKEMKRLALAYQKEGISGLCKETSVDRFPGVNVGVSEHVRGRMADLTVDKNDHVVLRMQAEKLHRFASQQGDIQKFYELVSDYPLWTHGPQTFIQLGDIHFSRGEVDRAIGIWKRLENVSGSASPDLHARVALASFLNGDVQAYQSMVKKYREKTEEVEIDGKKTKVSRFLESLPSTLVPARPHNWLDYGGNPAHHVVFSEFDWKKASLQAVYRVPNTGQHLYYTKHSDYLKDRLLVSPLSFKDRLYFSYPWTLFSLDTKTLKLAWNFYPKKPYELRPRFENRFGRNGVADFTERSHEERICTAAISEGTVYSFLPHHIPGNTIYAVSAADGKPIWQWPPEKAEQNVLFNSAPVVVDGKLFAGATELSGQLNAVLFCLDATPSPGGDRLLWKRFLGSVIVWDYKSNTKVHLIPKSSGVTSCYGLVYCCTNIGVVAAVDVYNGEIRWLSKYHEHSQNKYRLRKSPSQQLERNGAPPIAKHGKLYVMPADSPYLFVYDAITGMLQKIFPEDQYEVTFNQLFGVGEQGEIFLGAGRVVVSVSPEGEKEIAWQIDLPDPVKGQAMLSRKHLYVLAGDFLYQIDTRNGKFKRILSGRKEQSRSPQLPKNARSILIVENGQDRHLVVTGDEVRIFKID